MRIVTHDSNFHMDDVFAVATLLLIEPGADVVRSRQKEIIESADYAVDVGFENDPSLRRFDHHQPCGAGERVNGIPYASFGLVWKEYGPKLAGGEEAVIIDEKLVQPIDAQDNGVSIAQYKFENISEYTITDFMYSGVTIEDQKPEKLQETFMRLVGTAQELLGREIERAKEAVKGERILKEIYDKADDKRVLELPSESGLPWKRLLSKLPEPLYVYYPRKDGNWSLKAVPKDRFILKKPLPEGWAGKTEGQLQEVTGVKDSIFAHNNRFLVTARSRGGIIELAKKALEY